MTAPEEVRSIPALLNGKEVTVLLELRDTLPDNPYLLSIDFIYEALHYTCIHDNYWHALQDLRLKLEKINMYLLCYGASLNVYPSGMQVDMGQGLLAYKLTLGQHAFRRDEVKGFDSGADVVPCTVEAQDKFYEEWGASLPSRSNT